MKKQKTICQIELKEEHKASFVLGVLSLCLGWAIPIFGVVLSIIGLSIKKSEEHSDRDILLNALGLAVSLFSWVWQTIYLLGI